MGRWYVPRLETLESRQVLDAALPLTAPTAPAALVGVADSVTAPPPSTPPAGNLATSTLVGNTPDTPAVLNAPAALDAASLTPLATNLGHAPDSTPDGSARLSSSTALADKKPESTVPNADLQASQAGASPIISHKEEVLPASLDSLSGKLTLAGLNGGSHREHRRAGKVAFLLGNPEAPHPQAASREVPPDPPHGVDPVFIRPDWPAERPLSHAPARAAFLAAMMMPAHPDDLGPEPPTAAVRTAGEGWALSERDALSVSASIGGFAAGLRLAELFTLEWQFAPAQGAAPASGQPMAGGLLTRGGGEVLLPPLYLSMVSLPTGKPLDPVAAGYLYLCNYARTAIHAAQRRAGPLSDHDDIIQQICLEWLQKAGPPQEAFPRLLDKLPAEMQLLRETVSRVIARVIYQQRKGRRMADLIDCPAPTRTAEQDWVEFQSDCTQGVGRLSPLEWQILECRRQGKTFAEIGADLGIARQRVWEVYHEVEARLRRIYASPEG